MKIRRKTNNCLNCNASLDGVYNYCPVCGQENNDNNVTFKNLMGDFFNTYLAIDSRFGKSIRPFLFKPGWLTNKYIEGKRVTYAHPVRFYLIVSIFYFFIVSKVGQKVVVEDNRQVVKIESGDAEKENKNIEKLIGEDSLISLQNIQDKDSIRALLGSKEFKNKIKEELKGKSTSDYADYDYSASFNTKDKSENSSGDDNDEFVIDRMNFDIINKYKHDDNVSNEQLFDSLQLGELSGFEELTARQTIRVVRSDSEAVTGYILKNLPLMMLILIPIFALILKLLYIRQKDLLYIKHLIHALHIHTFAYFLYGIGSTIMFFMTENEDYRLLIGLLFFVVNSVYAFISFRRVYHQHWFKTLMKFTFTGTIYLVFIIAFFLTEMLISFLLY